MVKSSGCAGISFEKEKGTERLDREVMGFETSFSSGEEEG